MSFGDTPQTVLPGSGPSPGVHSRSARQPGQTPVLKLSKSTDPCSPLAFRGTAAAASPVPVPSCPSCLCGQPSSLALLAPHTRAGAACARLHGGHKGGKWMTVQTTSCPVSDFGWLESSVKSGLGPARQGMPSGAPCVQGSVTNQQAQGSCGRAMMWRWTRRGHGVDGMWTWTWVAMVWTWV